MRKCIILQRKEIADILYFGFRFFLAVGVDCLLDLLDHSWSYVRSQNFSFRMQEFDLLADDSGTTSSTEYKRGTHNGRLNF
jgi:hypothetical protein